MGMMLLMSCLLFSLAAPCVSTAASGLHMWESDGAIIIQDKRPEQERAAPRPIRLANGTGSVTLAPLQDNASIAPAADESHPAPHPLRQMQQEHEAFMEATRQGELPIDPDVEAFVTQLRAQNPDFRAHWEQMTEQERREHLLMLSQGAGQLPVNLHLINTLMRLQWVFMLMALGGYLWLAWCMARICQPLGAGSFLQFLIPIWNIYLPVKAANFSGWLVLLYLVPLVNVGFHFHVMGTLARRHGKPYVAWGLALTFGAMFTGLLIGVLPFHLLARHAHAQRPWSAPSPLSATS